MRMERTLSVEEIISILKEKRHYGATVFICGNGGSASNAEHFTNDLFSRGVRAVCLNSNVSIITMVANDYGYEYIFSKQLEVYAKQGDLLILISCSGTSKNIQQAMSYDIDQLKFFGGKGTYGDMESRHLFDMHKIAESLGDKIQ